MFRFANATWSMNFNWNLVHVYPFWLAFGLRGLIQINCNIFNLQTCALFCFCSFRKQIYSARSTFGKSSLPARVQLSVLRKLTEDEMISTWLSAPVIMAVLLISAFAHNDEGHEKAEQDRDHLSVGIMRKPDHCPRESKDGDHLTVRYNNTLIDQTPVLSTR